MAQTGGPQSSAFEQPKANPMFLLRRLWGYLSRYRMMVLVSLALSIASNLLALVGPKLSGNALDAMQPGTGKVDFRTVFSYCGLMLLFYLLSSLLGYLLSLVMVTISRNMVTQMRQEAYEHILRLPVRFFDGAGTGDLLSVLSYDIDTINASLSNDLVQMLASVITVAGSLWMMLTISPPLVLVFAVTIPVSVFFTKKRSAKARKLYRLRSQKLGALNSYAEEITGGLPTIKAYHAQQAFRSRFEDCNAQACQANYEADSFAAVTGPAVSFINNLSLALISMFGAALYMSGAATLGGISSFVLYSRKFSGPINEFSNIVSELQSALAAAERVLRLLDIPPEPEDSPQAAWLPKEDIRGGIRLHHVKFGYSPDRPVLKNVTLTVKPGQTVAIVGPTGAGKTTVINLLMRFYDVDDGAIFLDGQDIRTLRRADVRGSFAMVLQDTWLFSGSIYENLAYGKDGITREEVAAAAKAARIHRYIQSLPQGYDTQLQDCSANISKGQKQLLTIARAILLDAPMLILDEATSNVDTQTERSIQAAMLQLMHGRTCFVIAHRLSTIRGADLIAVMQDGCIAECGTHHALMKAQGIYARLYQAQFDKAEDLEPPPPETETALVPKT